MKSPIWNWMLGISRVLIGAAGLVAPNVTLKLVKTKVRDPLFVKMLLRGVCVRDIILGLGMFSTKNLTERKRWLIGASLADAVDLASMPIAWARMASPVRGVVVATNLLYLAGEITASVLTPPRVSLPVLVGDRKSEIVAQPSL